MATIFRDGRFPKTMPTDSPSAVPGHRHVHPRAQAAQAAAAARAATAQVPAEAQASAEPQMPDLPEISVDGVVIGEAEIRAEMHNHPAPDARRAYAEAARALVIRELLLGAARRRDLRATPETDAAGKREVDDDALLRALLDAEVTTPTADAAACRRYYDRNPGKFTSGTIYEARHILLAAPESDAAARKAAEDTARRLIAVLQDDPSAFAALAEAHSACPSRAQGGNLGQVTAGSTVPEFERALAGLGAGQMVAEPVGSRFGFHVIALDRVIAGETLPFELVEARIAAWLEASSWSRGVAQFIGVLAGAADIRGITLNGADGALVQ